MVGEKSSDYAVLFDKLDIPPEMLRSIPAHRAGFWVLSCLAYSDVTLLSKLSLAVSHDYPVDLLGRRIFASQQFSAIRMLNLRLYSYILALDELGRPAKEANDAGLLSFLTEHSDARRKLKSGDVWKLLGRIRNTISAHLDLSLGNDAIQSIDETQDNLILLDEMVGTSHYLFGSEIVFNKLIAGSSTTQTEDGWRRTIEPWMQWSVDAIGFFFSFHEEFSVFMYKEHLATLRPTPVFVKMKRRNVAKAGKFRLPLHVQRE